MAEATTCHPADGGGHLRRQRVRALFLADRLSRLDVLGITESMAVRCSVRKARITENTCELILELKGCDRDLARLRQALAEQGVEVELIEEEQIL